MSGLSCQSKYSFLDLDDGLLLKYKYYIKSKL